MLNTSNVSPATFGRLFTRAVDDQVYAQPLYVPEVDVPHVGSRNVLFVATTNGTVYAFDADDPGAAAPLWRVRLASGSPTARPVKNTDVGLGCEDERGGRSYPDFSGNIGIVGTPVVDLSGETLLVVVRTREASWFNSAVIRTLYVGARKIKNIARDMEIGGSAQPILGLVGIGDNRIIQAAVRSLHSTARMLESLARTAEDRAFIQRLHALDLSTGAERPNSPIVIKASVQGTGIGSSNGILHFDPRIHNQRGALLLANNTVYIAWGSHCDIGPYHGWIMGYDRTTLAQVFAKVVTPSGKAGGIWQANSGPSADASGNIYFTVGNGTVTAPIGGQDYGNAFLKLNPSGEVLDWFIPFNFEALNAIDGDVGSTAILLIPESNLLAGGGKEGKLYLLNRDNLGHFQPDSDSQIVQSFFVGGPFFSTPTYWKGPSGPHVYTWCSWDRGRQFRLDDKLLIFAPTSQTTMVANGRPGGILTISADGERAGTGILWSALGLSDATEQTVPGVLRAFDAEDLTRELWNSRQNPLRDDFGNFAKFNAPIIANGKVYLATFSQQVAVYGLLPPHDRAPTVNAGSDRAVGASDDVIVVGTASDDGHPHGTLTTRWVQVSGPGEAAFMTPHSLASPVRFSVPGTYILRLTASDGAVSSDSNVKIEVRPLN